ncbi:MAG TPA: class IV adenylate cyclase [Pirellulales bacterium]|nr:class IV adenylate cyclase [Pirellulales bacterium]
MASASPQQPRRNIELKARIASVDAARPIAARLATATLGVERQTDAYFAGARGRLKLRERQGLPAQLVWYARADGEQAKPSDYLLVDVTDAAALKQALAAAYGVLVVVDKQREIYLHENVRIHLDRVEGLGDFLEFEAVLAPDEEDAAGYVKLAALSREFAIEPPHLVASSYSDLLLVERSSRG